MSNKPIVIREWLNPAGHYDSGFVSCIMEDPKYDMSLRIGDCSKIVSLDFTFHSEATRKQRLAKVRKLRKVLDALELHIATCELKKKGR